MSEETARAASVLACGDATPRDRRNLRQYQVSLIMFALSYVAVVLLIRAGVVSGNGFGWLVALLPSVVALLPVIAFVRFLAEADEMQRLIQLQALAVAFAAGFVLWPALITLARLGVAVPARDDVLTMTIILAYVAGVVMNRRRFR
jgi:hypothetical protein